MVKTPLESRISTKIWGTAGIDLTQDAIQRYQLEKLGSVIDYVRGNSQFYREQLRGASSKDFRDLKDLESLPFTTAEDLKNRGPEFLCVSQSRVERVVTLPWPDPGDNPRRVHFTGQDLELTVDFFHHGMLTLVRPGQSVLILMPGERPGSVGDLLAKGLERAGVTALIHGIVADPAPVIRKIVENRIDCLVGIPTQVLSLAQHENAIEIPSGRIKSVLLSADYVSPPLAYEIRRTWDCKVFKHYGTTEMGFGGGVECEAFAGYHLREADLLFEIVDPLSGSPLPDGETGEIVFTTLTREAMPLIRYRTGDLSRMITDPCHCGTVLKRLEKVRGKIGDMVRLQSGDLLGMADLDDVLFAIPGIVNFAARLATCSEADRLELAVHPASYGDPPPREAITAALAAVPILESALAQGSMVIGPIRFSVKERPSTGAVKRTIVRDPTEFCVKNREGIHNER